MQRSNKFILWQSRTLQSLLTEPDTLGWLEDIPTEHLPVLLQHEQVSARAGESQRMFQFSDLMVSSFHMKHLSWFCFLVAVVLWNWPH